MRLAGLAQTPHAMLSRGLAGTRDRTLIINLPGSPRAAGENLAAVINVLPHALDKLKGDPRDCGR
jgi:molybdopterin adenylyltransferase